MTSGINRRHSLGMLAATGLGFWSKGIHAVPAFPDRPIKLIVPFPAGGGTDRHLRVLAEIASKQLGQGIIIENRPGAGGTLAPGQMSLTASADGYTICVFPLAMLRMPYMQKTQWDPIGHFTPIIGLSGYTFGLTVRGDSPYRTLREFVDAARKAPGTITYGSAGTGTSPHLLMEEFSIAAKIQLTHVPFKGNADLMQALLGGHVMSQCDAAGWEQYVDAGRMRLLVTFGQSRTQRWPQVRTAMEQGYGLVAASPYGLVGPKGMNPAVVKTIHDAFHKALDDPKNAVILNQLGQDIWYRNSDDYAHWIRETFSASGSLVARLGLSAK